MCRLADPCSIRTLFLSGRPFLETGLRLWLPNFQIKVRQKRYKRYKSPSDVPACRSFLDHGRSAPKFRQVDFDKQSVALLTTRTSPIYGPAALSETMGSVRWRVSLMASPPLVDT